MDEFISATFAYPTVIFTVLLAAAGVYWLLVIFGAIGIDALDIDLDLEGAADGVAEGAAEGAAEAGADHATDGAPHKGHAHGSFVSSILHSLKLDAAPLTVVLSLYFFFSWLLTNLGRHYLIDGMGLRPVWLVGSGLLLGSVVVALPLTAMLVRPLGKILVVEAAISRKDLVGKIVRIDTSRVDARFGQALAEDGGAGLIVPVRCDGDNSLGRGSQALVVSYDAAREAYEVAPLDDIVPSEARAKT